MLNKLLAFIVRLARDQAGQMLVPGLGLILIGLLAIMITADVGWWLRDKRDAQNDADSIAHAASFELPDTAAAVDRGEAWALANGIDPATQMAVPPCSIQGPGTLVGKFCFEDTAGQGSFDLVRVKVLRTSRTFMGQAFGVPDPDIAALAAAAKVYVVAACVMPWGIVIQNTDRGDYYGLDRTALYVFQNTEDFVGQDGLSAEESPGNFGAISIYGEGANVYKDSIMGVCEPKKNACTADPMVFVDETLLGCTSEPGKQGAVTANTLDERYPDPAACDVESYEQAVNSVAATSSPCLGRAVPIAVIDAFPPQGSSADITIYGIANFYIAGWSKNQTCFGDACGYVWGYLLENVPASTAQVVLSREFIPFAPTGVAIVE